MQLPSEKFLAARPEKRRDAEPAEEITPRSLNDFVGDVRDAARFTADFSAELGRLHLPGGADSNLLFQVAQTLFETDVARRGDLKNHIALRRLRQADRTIELREYTLALNREKFHFRAAEAVLTHFAEIKAVHDNHALPPAEKIEAMRQILFAALPNPSDDQNSDHDLPEDAEEIPNFS